MPLAALLEPVDRTVHGDPEMPAFPGLFLGFHIVNAGTCSGAALGATAGTVFHAMQTLRGTATMWLPTRLLRSSTIGVGVGVVFGTVALLHSAITKDNMDANGIADRAFRIKFNKMCRPLQVPSEVNGLTVGLLGAIATPLLAPPSLGSTAVRVVGGYGLGALVGLVCAAAIGSAGNSSES